MKICIVDGCENKRHVKIGYCGKHYAKFKAHGDPLGGRRGASPGAPLKWIHDNANYQGDDCIAWPFEVTHHGYGSIKHNGKRRVASRVMCEIAHGMPPQEKMDAAHSCGNGHKACMNPRHLSWKTRKGNAQDAIRHGTWVHGEKMPSHVLTERKAKKIADLKGQLRQTEIAELLGVDVDLVGKVHAGLTWAWATKGVASKVSKFSRGQDHYCAKITPDDVREIRRLRGKVKQKDLAKKYEIDPSQVGKIQRRVWWAWVED